MGVLLAELLPVVVVLPVVVLLGLELILVLLLFREKRFGVEEFKRAWIFSVLELSWLYWLSHSMMLGLELERGSPRDRLSVCGWFSNNAEEFIAFSFFVLKSWFSVI